MKIIIGGDVVPTSVNMKLFESGDIVSLLGSDLLERWQDADFRIINLEAPITESQTSILKWGPNLKAPTQAFRAIERLTPDLVGLANNHIMDFGACGLLDTVKKLSGAGIDSFGAGENLRKAHIPYIVKNNETSVGVYACAEHEFSIADSERPGANPFDPLYSLDHIIELKSKCDYVIVLYHGGKEYYRYPSPRLRQICKKMADKGADLVLCQHSHCIGSYEEYNGSHILYGQGNFLFAKDYLDEFLESGLLVQAKFSDKLKVDFIPIVRHKNGIRIANGPKGDEIMESFARRSEALLNEGFVEGEYEKFAKSKKLMYMRKISSGENFMGRIDEKLFGNRFLCKKYSRKKQMMLLNYMECEAHRELIVKGLKEEI